MREDVNSYLKPQTKIIPLRSSANICAGSGNIQFLNDEGTQGFVNSTIEQNGNAAEAASRSFGDEEYEGDY